nr:AraC family transcriptional regulator [uncultured Psychroserpens sp.]
MKFSEISNSQESSMHEQHDVMTKSVIEQQNLPYSNSFLKAIKKSIPLKTANSKNGINKFLVDSSSNSGQIDFITFQDNIEVTNLDVYFTKDVVINISEDKSKLYFLYMLEGVSYHSFNNSNNHSRIDELRTVAFAVAETNSSKLIIRKDKPYKANIIAIDKAFYVKNFAPNFNVEDDRINSINQIFDALNEELLQSSLNLNITKEMRLINNELSLNCLTSTLKLQSRYQIILSQHIENLYAETCSKKSFKNVSRAEIQKIRVITNHIIENPGLNHSQETLCSQFYISQSKLQYCFKTIHKSTVSNFTRNVRLERAEELLSTSDLNVSEIVFTVGFTSRSYFSKIFKHKYNCNPTEYRAKFNKSWTS